MKNALSLLVTLFAVAGAEAVPPPVLAPAVGPLMFLFGTETEAVLRQTVNEIADGGNQMLTAESRHHADWYGPTWWRDLNIICDEAKKRNLKVVLFDDPWFPSQMMKGRVPVAFSNASARNSTAGAIDFSVRFALPTSASAFVSAVKLWTCFFPLSSV